MKLPIPEHCASKYVVRVRFAETDLMGIAHHGSYLLYFEAARVEYLHRRGVSFNEWAERAIHLPVIAAELRYKKPSRFDECLVVEARLYELSRIKVGFAYSARREPGGELVAEGQTLLACVGNDQRPKRLPPDVLEVLLQAETHPRPVDQV